MSRARFSVLCPTYNRSSAIAATIESVLAQSCADFDLIVGSDGSTDDTNDVVAEFARVDRRVKLLKFDHTGDPGLVRSRLCQEISNDYVAYIDHDDLWLEDHLAILGATLDRGAPLVATGAEYRCVDGTARILSGRGLLWHPEVAVVDPYAEPSRVAHRRDALDLAGGWKSAKGGLEDWDLWWRMSAKGIVLQPVDAPSAVVNISRTTRRNSMVYQLVMPLISAGCEATARGIAAEQNEQGLAEVLAADFSQWSAELHKDPQTVMPLECPRLTSEGVGPGFGVERSDSGTTASSQPGTVLTMAAYPGGREGWLVGLGAPLVSRNHSRNLKSVLRNRFPIGISDLKESLSLKLRDSVE